MKLSAGVLFFGCWAASTGWAYQLKTDSTGSVDPWRTSVAWVMDENLPQQLGEPRVLEAINAAIASYRPTVPFALSVSTGPSTGIGYDVTPGATNQSEIIALSSWDYDPNAIAITVVTVDTRSHSVLDADIALNLASRQFRVLAAATPGGPDDDLQNTLTHELGHALGLAHNLTDTTVVMFRSAARGEVSKRVLQPDDLAGIAALYPAVSQSVTPAGGCSTAGAGGVPAVLLLLLPVLLRRKRQLLAAMAVTSVLALSAAASEDRRTPALARTAAVVLTATVEQVRTREPKAGTRVFVTELRIHLRGCLKGDCPEYLTVLVPGGRWGDLEQWIDGAPVPLPGSVLGVTVAPGTAAAAPEPKQTGIYRLDLAKDWAAFAIGLADASLPPLSH